jgi:GxxExxY protein
MHPLYNQAHAWPDKVIRTTSLVDGVPPELRCFSEVDSPLENAANLFWFYTKVAKKRKEAMHPLYPKAHALSSKVIGAAIEVHRLKGPGLIESIYEKCLMRELELQGIAATNQVPVKIEYKGLVFEEPLRLDVFIENCLIVENKVVEQLLPVHKAQLLSYMKLLNVSLGLLINYHEPVLKNGIVRLILEGADKP